MAYAMPALPNRPQFAQQQAAPTYPSLSTPGASSSTSSASPTTLVHNESTPPATTNNGKGPAASDTPLTLEQMHITAVEGIVPTLQ